MKGIDDAKKWRLSPLFQFQFVQTKENENDIMTVAVFTTRLPCVYIDIFMQRR